MWAVASRGLRRVAGDDGGTKFGADVGTEFGADIVTEFGADVGTGFGADVGAGRGGGKSAAHCATSATEDISSAPEGVTYLSVLCHPGVRVAPSALLP